MENEANAFAAALLMPANDIRESFLGRKIDLGVLAALKPEWRVSMQSLLMRARDLGTVSPNQAQYLWKQFNIKKIRMREPPELDFPAEVPTVLETVLRLHLDSLGFTLSDLSKMLHLYEADLADLYPIERTEEIPRRRFTVLK
jgi:Zn-dependent peptidase ImmA (M78 family)